MKEEFRKLDLESSSIEDVNTKLGIISENLNSESLLYSIDIGQRTVQECPNLEERLVLTSYFTSKADPQDTSKRATTDSYEYIQPWYESIMSLGLNGIVFHDGLSSEFIKKYSNERVQFLYCQLGDKSLNDERFILYYIFLCKNADRIKTVFMTDGNDVKIQHNPSEYIKSFHKDVIFVGRNNGNRIRQSLFNMRRLPQFQRSLGKRIENRFIHQALYNAGILGGQVGVVLRFLEQISRILLSCNGGNNNMLAFNYVLFKYWNTNANTNWNKFLGYWLTPSLYLKVRRFKYNRIVKRFINLTPDHSSFRDKIGNWGVIHTSGPFCSPFKKYSKDPRYIFLHK